MKETRTQTNTLTLGETGQKETKSQSNKQAILDWFDQPKVEEVKISRKELNIYSTVKLLPFVMLALFTASMVVTLYRILGGLKGLAGPESQVVREQFTANLPIYRVMIEKSSSTLRCLLGSAIPLILSEFYVDELNRENKGVSKELLVGLTVI